MLLFRSEEHVDRWCRKRNVSRGAILSIPQLWGLAEAWHGDRLSEQWRRKTPAEAEAIFSEHGLIGPFWKLS
jgi:hypothetical protein